MLFLQEGRLKCNTCNFDIPVDKVPKGFDPLKIIHNCKNIKQNDIKYNRFKRPKLIKKAFNLAVASGKHIVKGKKRTEEKLLKLRLDICNTCDHGDNQDCFICGCNIATKASWAEQSCPLYKWPKDMKDLLFRNKQPANLANSLYGSGCFFIGSGPSLGYLDLNLLKERGILTFAVNNVAAYNNIRPNFWCSCDHPKSFHDVIWRDPGIMKFTRRGNPDKIPQQPNVYTFDINEDFKAATFFTEPTVCFGNHSNLIDEYGNKGGRSVMYPSFRIMHYLGIKRIYLIGCDFNMEEKQQYVFDQKKWVGGIKTNNQNYELMNTRFAALAIEGRKHGLSFFNCSPNSRLTAFDKLDFDTAIKKEKLDTPKSLADMYGKY